MLNRKSVVVIILLAFVIGGVTYNPAHAIPAFARRYKISCTTCHAPFPSLKDYGDDFAGDGFVIPEEERERDYVSAGDDKLWLNREFPLAVKFEAYALTNDSDDAVHDLEIPWGMKLLSGGPLFKNISYYFYMYMSERGEVVGLEDAYIHFNDIFGSNLDIMAGQFQTSDPLMKRELRLTFEDYHVYKRGIGHSTTDLTYDRGFMFVYGIEKTGTDVILMAVNGNGIPEAGEDKIFDRDKYKNGGVRISQGVGGHLSIGGFYYLGKETAPADTLMGKNEVSYMGPDLGISIDRFSLTGQYLLRKDSNPMFVESPGEDIETEGLVAELVFSPDYDQSDFYFILLYNYIKSDLKRYNYETVTLSGTYLLARNARLLAEYTRDVENEVNHFVLGVVSAF